MVERIMYFLSAPQMPDIIGYVLSLSLLILYGFIKRFVKKDNLMTLSKVDLKTKSLDELRQSFSLEQEQLKVLQERFKAEQEFLQNERRLFEEEKAQLVMEVKKSVEAVFADIDNVKGILKLGFNNVDSLVKSGYSNKIAKLLSGETEEFKEDIDNA